jgi:hypothetical protein
MGKKVGWALVGALLLMSIAGCSGMSAVTEEDRVVVDHSVQIARLQKAKLEVLAGILTNDPARALMALKEIEALTEDALANGEQLQRNWGPPKEPTPYSAEAAKQAREKSGGSHDVGFWSMLGGALLTGGAVALGIARKFGRFVPGFGPVFAALDTTISAVETFMQKKKASGDVDVVAELRDTLQTAHEDANLRPYIDKVLGKAQEKLGVPVGAILPAAPPAAAPAAPSASPT